MSERPDIVIVIDDDASLQRALGRLLCPVPSVV
jgi:hypothetical protein